MWKIASATALVVAIFSSFLLKTMQLFNWISWHPTTFLKDMVAHAFLRWLALGFFIFIGTVILYLIVQYIYKAPRYVPGFVIGLAIGFVLEWWILDLPATGSSFKELSIPFLVLVTTMALFVVETATFHRESFVNRNNLPYKATVLK